MPNLRINNSIPNMGIRNTTPNVRASSFQTGMVGTVIQAGTPIGLLLSLTYSSKFTPTVFFGERPNMRIKND